ncbi:MAG: hypothetical protein ACKO70_10940, partial [Actinomycetota bacterium]
VKSASRSIDAASVKSQKLPPVEVVRKTTVKDSTDLSLDEGTPPTGYLDFMQDMILKRAFKDF